MKRSGKICFKKLKMKIQIFNRAKENREISSKTKESIALNVLFLSRNTEEEEITCAYESEHSEKMP